MKKIITTRKCGSIKVSQETVGSSRTKQSFKDECCVHKIMDKHKRTGIMKVNKFYERPQYGDFSNPVEYQEAQNIIIAAHDQFDMLPASIRKKFDNDPATFLEFCTNPENSDAMIEMGIKEPIEVKTNNDNENAPSKAPKKAVTAVSKDLPKDDKGID